MFLLTIPSQNHTYIIMLFNVFYKIQALIFVSVLIDRNLYFVHFQSVRLIAIINVSVVAKVLY